MIAIALKCHDHLGGDDYFIGSFDSFEGAKAAYDEHMAKKHPPDPRDEMIRQLIANLYPEACKQAWRTKAIALGVKL